MSDAVLNQDKSPEPITRNRLSIEPNTIEVTVRHIEAKQGKRLGYFSYTAILRLPHLFKQFQTIASEQVCEFKRLRFVIGRYTTRAEIIIAPVSAD